MISKNATKASYDLLADEVAADVVVVTHNSAEHVRVSVEAFVHASRFRVIAVDNGSTDTTLDTLKGLDVTTISQGNLGFAHACNVGWRQGTAPAVLFLNPDATIAPADVDLLVDVLEDESVGIVGPQIHGDDGTLSYSQRRFPRIASTLGQAMFLPRLLPRSSWPTEIVRDEASYVTARDAEWLSGACLLVRRSLLTTIGGWDESYFLYSEDAQLCRDAWRAGFRVRFEPRASALHTGGESAPRAGLLGVLARSRVAYARNNNSRVVAFTHRCGIGLDAITHLIVCRGGLKQRKGHFDAIREVVRRQGSPLRRRRRADTSQTVGGERG